MNTFVDLAKVLNRSTVYLSGLQSRFELPTFDGAGYSEAYLAFFQTVVHLRTLSITEEALRDLWHIEKKLLVLLHADSTGSHTWFLDSCGATTSPKRRLLLTNYELGLQHVDSLAPHARVALWAACRCLSRFAPLTSAHRHCPRTLCGSGDGRRRPACPPRLPQTPRPHQRRCEG